MQKTLQQLADIVKGRVVGDPNKVIVGISTLERASSDEITFLANPKYEAKIPNSKAGAIITLKKLDSSASLIIADDPYYAFCELMVLFYGHRNHNFDGISEKADIDDSAIIGSNTTIYSGVFVGPNTKIGSDCVIHSNVVIYEKCQIGNGVVIHSNSSIGQDGFGYATHNGVHHKIPHIGSVIIGDDVEIGCGCAIERGSLDETIIGKGTKIGDLVTVGHGCQIGKHCLFVPQCGIAGSTKIGDYTVIGGQAGITGHLEIGNFVQIAAQAGVINNIPDGSAVLGAPAVEAGCGRRAYSLIKNLPTMKRDIDKLKKQIGNGQGK